MPSETIPRHRNRRIRRPYRPYRHVAQKPPMQHPHANPLRRRSRLPYAAARRCRRNHPRQQPPHTLAGGGLHLRQSALYRLDLPTKEQKNDLESICGHIKGYGLLDYVCNWYVKAAGIMAQNPQVQTAFVSTNSICQGQQVEILWGSLLNQGIEINFAHRTFQWTSQAAGKAAVHCIIVGFSRKPQTSSENGGANASANPALPKYLYDYPDIKGEPVKNAVANINPYLIDAPDLIITKRKTQISRENEMCKGNQPTDGGNLILSTDEKEALIAAEPLAEQYIYPFIGAEEFINGKTRWCLWFHGVSDVKRNHDLKQMPKVQARIQAVKAMREASRKAATQKKAATPWLFDENPSAFRRQLSCYSRSIIGNTSFYSYWFLIF